MPQNNFDKINAVKEKIAKDLFEFKVNKKLQLFESFSMTSELGGLENIVGVGLSETNGIYKVSLLVEEEMPYNLSTLFENYNIYTKEIEVVAIGKIELQTKTYVRPTPPGWSIGHLNVTAGTLGVWVKDGAKRYILSNNHVLANLNNASIGDAILQPGPIDGGKFPGHLIAQLTKFKSIDFNGANIMDAAIAEASASDVKEPIPQIGHVTAHSAEKVNMTVEKYGRTTKYTSGKITKIKTDVYVPIKGKQVLFKNTMLIQKNGAAISDGGDSGSLIVDKNSKKAIGLLFAGGPKVTLANQIGPILNYFGVQLA